MKILHVITNLNTGGAEKLMVDLLPRLRSLDCEAELLVFDGHSTPFYEQLEATGVPIHSLGMIPNVYHPLYLWRLFRFLRTHKYDIVHTHNTAPQLFAALVSKLTSVMLCTTEHTTSNRRRAWKWYAPIDRWMYTRYARVICISDQAEKNLRCHLAKDFGTKICTIYNGADVSRFAQAEPSRALLVSKGRRKAVVMVARFTYQKDQDTLVRALRLLPSADYELWLVGNGERMEEVKRLAESEGIAARVKFLGLRMDVPQVLKAADVVVMSSHFEGLSLSNIEGMSVGKPFVASDVDGLREVTAGAGLLFPHADAAALADVIQRLCCDKELYKQVAQRCYERARQFDISVMAQNYCNAYEALLSK